jgi:hypothetical protein
MTDSIRTVGRTLDPRGSAGRSSVLRRWGPGCTPSRLGARLDGPYAPPTPLRIHPLDRTQSTGRKSRRRPARPVGDPLSPSSWRSVHDLGTGNRPAVTVSDDGAVIVASILSDRAVWIDVDPHRSGGVDAGPLAGAGGRRRWSWQAVQLGTSAGAPATLCKTLRARCRPASHRCRPASHRCRPASHRCRPASHRSRPASRRSRLADLLSAPTGLLTRGRLFVPERGRAERVKHVRPDGATLMVQCVAATYLRNAPDKVLRQDTWRDRGDEIGQRRTGRSGVRDRGLV